MAALGAMAQGKDTPESDAELEVRYQKMVAQREALAKQRALAAAAAEAAEAEAREKAARGQRDRAKAERETRAGAPDVQTASPDGAGSGPAQILDLTDSLLIARAWETLFPDSSLPAGEYQILIPAGPELSTGRSYSATVYLLRNGTEAGHMDRSAWETLSTMSSNESEGGWAEAMEGPERQDVPLLWKSFKWEGHTLLDWAEWPGEATAGMGTAVSSIPSSKPQIQRDIDFTWSQKLYGHFLLGGELHRIQFGGGLTRMGAAVADTSFGKSPLVLSHDFWSEADWSWGLAAGVPGLKYTLSLASGPLPRYFWMEPGAAAAIRQHKSGRVVNQWKGTVMEREGNLSHTLDARLGILRYGFHFDSDAYRVPIQTFALDDLPAVFGTWGAGLVMASDILATRVWMDIPDASLRLGMPKAYPSRFRIAFLHLDLAYRNLRNFNLGVSVRVKVENPIMNRPGA
ncbi:MAG: hypothetical protein JWP91_1749 [Fibrobacteres bacterium]|nr:hypothetical protein [Fibrobacterota bacterium]